MNQFPKAALAQHIAVLGKTGSGKSYAVRGIVEGLLDDEARVCIIDPTGAWNGLRSSATGKSAGYPVVIFGGSHADLPLGGTHGEAIAEIIGTSSTPAIVDTSLMRVGERTRFFADFADALVRKNKGPLQLIIDEAHLFAPQGKVNDPQSGAMLHAANNLVSLGRSRGLRIILITQRPAKLHKDSLTQVETLVAMRLIAPQDRRAVEEWIEDNADEKKGKEIIASLATLKTGDGWVWAPELGILERIHFPKIKTFDSGRAPDGSEAAGQVLAPINREDIAEKLKKVGADALANDPALLKKRIAELERQAKTAQPVPFIDTTALKRRSFDEGYAAAAAAIAGVVAGVIKAGDEFMVQLRGITKTIERRQPAPVESPRQVAAIVRHESKRIAAIAPSRSANGHAPATDLSKAAMKVLAVLSQFPEGCEAGKLTLLTGYRFSGGFRNTLSELRTGGYIEGDNGGVMRITQAGEALGPFPQLPQGDELVTYWLNHNSFGKAAKAILAELVDGREKTAEQLSQATGYEYSGGFRNALSELRTAGVLIGSNTGTMRISPEIVP